VVSIIGLVLLLLSSLGFLHLFKGDLDSARYLLSALAQSMAAIYTLFLTIPLIGAQIMGNRYGIKLYDLFFDKTFSFLIFFGAFSVLIPLLVLGRIESPAPFAFLVDLSIIVDGAILACLFPYTFVVKEKLNPQRSTARIILKALKAIKESDFDETKKEMWLIRDIAIGSAAYNDVVTFQYCVEGLSDLWIRCPENSTKKLISNALVDLIFKPVSRTNPLIAIQGINALSRNVLRYIDLEIVKSAEKVLEILEKISYEVREFEVVDYISDQLGVLARSIIVDYPKITAESPEIIESIIQTISSIGSYTELRKKEGLFELIKRCADELGFIIYHTHRKVEDAEVKARFIKFCLNGLQNIAFSTREENRLSEEEKEEIYNEVQSSFDMVLTRIDNAIYSEEKNEHFVGVKILDVFIKEYQRLGRATKEKRDKETLQSICSGLERISKDEKEEMLKEMDVDVDLTLKRVRHLL